MPFIEIIRLHRADRTRPIVGIHVTVNTRQLSIREAQLVRVIVRPEPSCQDVTLPGFVLIHGHRLLVVVLTRAVTPALGVVVIWHITWPILIGVVIVSPRAGAWWVHRRWPPVRSIPLLKSWHSESMRYVIGQDRP